MKVVITVADGGDKKAVFAIVRTSGPVYLRLSRAAAPVFYPEDMKFEIGRALRSGRRGCNHYHHGTVLLQGPGSGRASGSRIQARVVDMHTIKPIDEELIIECASETGAIVTVENTLSAAVLGSAVAEVRQSICTVPMTRIGATDFAESGDYEQLW